MIIKTLKLLILVLVILFTLGSNVYSQTITLPDSVLTQQTGMEFSIDTEFKQINSTYFEYVYNPTIIRIDDIIPTQKSWKVVFEDNVGVVKIAALSDSVIAHNGPLFEMTVTPLRVGNTELKLVDVSWVDCRDLVTVIPIPKPEGYETFVETFNGDLYWIDPVYGVDNNTCREFDTPCLTDAPFQDKLQPGDGVILRGGIHRFTLNPVVSGLPDNYITYTKFPGEDVVITGTDIWGDDWSEVGNNVWVTPYNVSLPQHPAIAKPQKQWRPEIVVVDNQVLTTVYDVNNIKPYSFYVEGPSTNPTYLYINLDGIDPNNVNVEVGKRPHVLLSNIDYIHVNKLVFQHGANSFGKTGCVDISGDGWLVTYSLIVECNTTGIKYTGDGHEFVGVSSNYNGTVGWNSENSTNVKIINSSAIGNNTKGFLPNWHAGGMKITHGTDYTLISNFESKDNNGPGIWFDIPTGIGNVIENSFISNNQLSGIFLEHGTINSIVRDNVVYGTRKYNGTGSGIRLQAASSNLLENNTVYGNKGYGVFEKFKDKRSQPGYNVFVRNFVGHNVDGQVRIDRDPNETIVDFFQNNVYVVGGNTFKIENDYQGNSITSWLSRQLHSYPYDELVTDGVEDPTSEDGWRGLMDNVGVRK